MKIAIMSDAHDNWDNLKKAVDLSNETGCKYILFAGDLVSPSGIKVLKNFRGKVILVRGNNEGELLGIQSQTNQTDNVFIAFDGKNGLGALYEGTIQNKKIIMYHYPRLMKLAAQSGEFDICIFGHTHKLFHEKLGDTILLNPGSLQGQNHLNSKPATFCIIDLEDVSVEVQTISAEN